MRALAASGSVQLRENLSLSLICSLGFCIPAEANAAQPYPRAAAAAESTWLRKENCSLKTRCRAFFVLVFFASYGTRVLCLAGIAQQPHRCRWCPVPARWWLCGHPPTSSPVPRPVSAVPICSGPPLCVHTRVCRIRPWLELCHPLRDMSRCRIN